MVAEDAGPSDEGPADGGDGDGGQPADDGGRPNDAGRGDGGSIVDAGAPPLDAGHAPADGGALIDAGSLLDDAGTASDAGNADAGPFDAGGGDAGWHGDGGAPLCAPGDDLRIVVAPATDEHPRNTEGDVILLDDGRLFLAYSAFEQANDHAPARVVGRWSDDDGASWSAPQVLVEHDQGSQNAMIVSLLRLSDGRILLGYSKQTDLGDSRFYVRFSSDEGDTWTSDVLVTPDVRYGYVYNFAPLELSSGRLLAPYMFHEGGPYQAPGHFVVSVFASDDGGFTWVEQPGVIDLPGRGAMEPGLVELDGGEVLMTLRTTLGFVCASTSDDEGASWTAPVATTLLNPESAVATGRLSADELLVVYNRHYEPNGPRHSGVRRPLSTAFSADGQTFTFGPDLETDPACAYSYPSITTYGDRVLLTHYLGAQGPSGRRLSLVFRSLTRDALRGSCLLP